MARLDPRLREDAAQPARVGAANEAFIAWAARYRGP